MWAKIRKEVWTTKLSFDKEEYQFSGSCSFVVASKAKALKENLKAWNEGVF